MQERVRQALRQAYRIRNAEKAQKLLKNLSSQLKEQHPGAASSLEDGLDETLTVMGLGLPEDLKKLLSVTNAIENLFRTVREVSHRVKRWGSGKMILRWSASGILEAAKGFRKVRGDKGLPTLVAALEELDGKYGIDHHVERIRETA